MRKGVLRACAMGLLVGALLALIYGLHLLYRPQYDPNLNVAFVGTYDDADCIVLWQKDFAMMIDTGEDRDGENILNFLRDNDISKLDYLVLTHPDKDHIGSAPAIIQALDVGTVVQPFYQKENDANRFLQARLAQSRVKVVTPARVLHYNVNDMDIYIYPPQEKAYNDDNNYSLAVQVRHRNVGMLFPGDAEDKRLAELMQQDWGTVNLYKLPRHGRYSENSMAFFSTLRPACTVVTARAADRLLSETGDEWATQWVFTVDSTVVFQSNGETVSMAGSVRPAHPSPF